MSSIGTISLDLGINKSTFNKQISSIGSETKKSFDFAGVAVGNIVAGMVQSIVSSIDDAIGSCIELGSNLAEIQNVVDVTFPTMSAEVDSFARTAMTSFGLSETVAKKYVSTLGAMSKAFGFTESQSLSMAESIAGLTGDVASFYNISTDEAYTKLKSIYTGETESLKDLGVVMTQAALAEYAQANGISKSIDAMTEKEKVSLRLMFVEDKLAAASGDFARTSGGWANQTRVLSLRFDSLKASIGQGLIAALLPVVKLLNSIVEGLQTTADAFSAFMTSVFGAAPAASGALGSVVSDISGITSGAEEAASAVGSIGTAGGKAAKFLAGFDTITKISSSSSSSSGGSSGFGASDDSLAGTTEQQANAANAALDVVKAKIAEIKEMFMSGFSQGLGDTNFDSIIESAGSIKASLLDIFMDPKLALAENNWALSVSESLGKMAGSAASIGTTIVQNLMGGISTYFVANKDKIKDYIVIMFDLSAKMQEIKANLSVAVADIFSVFGNADSQQITADVLQIFSDAFMNVTELAGKLGTDVMGAISKPITDNKDALKKSLEKTIAPVRKMLDTVAAGFDDTWGKIQSTYDKKFAPMFDSIGDGLSEIVYTFTTTYDTYIVPFIEKFGSKFSEMFNNKIKPAIDSGVTALGKLAEFIGVLWEQYLSPLIQWLITVVVPALMPVIEDIANAAQTMIGGIMDALGGLLDAIGGLLDFLIGVFTGDWEKAWTGIKEFAGGIWKAISGIFEAAWGAICLIFAPAVETFKNIWTGIKDAFANVKTFFGDLFDAAWDLIELAFSDPGKFFLVLWNNIKSIFGPVQKFFKDAFDSAWISIKAAFNDVGNFFGGIWDTVKSKFTDLGEAIGSAVGDSFKNAINGVISTVETILNKAIGVINSAIQTYNDIAPGTSMDMKKMSTVSLTRLAKGGVINAPTLAMVGEAGREAVVPLENNLGWLDKLASIIATKLAASAGSGDIYITVPIQIGDEIVDVVIRKVERNNRLVNA